jgi:hypothetical protein
MLIEHTKVPATFTKSFKFVCNNNTSATFFIKTLHNKKISFSITDPTSAQVRAVAVSA